MSRSCDFLTIWLDWFFYGAHISSRFVTSTLVPGGVFLPFMSESLTDRLAISPFLPLLGRVFVLLISSEINHEINMRNRRIRYIHVICRIFLPP